MKWSNKGCIGGFLITVFFSIIIPAYTNFSPVELFRKIDPIAQDIITIIGIIIVIYLIIKNNKDNNKK